MSSSELSPAPAAAPDTAVLLVLLPVAGSGGPPLSLAGVAATLRHLQHCLGPAVRVMKIDEASHPAVVRSFHCAQLPACVLVRQGIELWRQQGLPEAQGTAELLRKLGVGNV